MKILSQNLKKGEITVHIEDLDDIWTLSKLIENTDQIKGVTERKIKIGDSATDRNVKTIRKTVILTISVEKSEYEPSLHQLRVTGTIIDGPEDIPRGEYHSFSLATKSQITLIKKEWLSVQKKQLEDAQRQSGTILICFYDRDKAIIGILSRKGFEKLGEYTRDSEKKVDVQTQNVPATQQLITSLTTYAEKYSPIVCVLASPDFFKNEILSKLPESVQKKTKHIAISDITEASLQQLLQNPQFASIREVEFLSNQQHIMDKILKEISKDGKAEYGITNITNIAELGAIQTCFVAHELLKTSREKNTFEQLKQLCVTIEQNGGIIQFIEEENPLHKTIMGLGGICALLRYKPN